MKKRFAIITDIHSNLEALEAILNDIKTQNIDEIICLGDTIGIGKNSKECIDLLINNHVKSVLGDHEIYLLKGTDINSSISEKEKEYYKSLKESLTKTEMNYIKNCPLYYEINIKYENPNLKRKYILCHYLINDENAPYPFEKNNLKNDINLWKKYNDSNITYIIGHLHTSFDSNDVEGIKGDFIEDDKTLTNIEVIDSAGCAKDDYTSYKIIEISKELKQQLRKIKYTNEKISNTM